MGERRALVKRLRADGRRDEAAVVAALAKPSVAGWAANQVLRSQPQDARELLSAGDALAQADRTSLREAIGRHREVMGRLLAAAGGLLDPDGRGLSGPTLERVQQTLNAASLDPELREEAMSARLTKEHVYSGLGLGFAASQPEPPKPRPAPRRAAGPVSQEKSAAAKRAAAVKAEREEAAARKRQATRLRAAQKRLATAEARSASAEAALAQARAEEARARAELDALEG